jgi:hypothetical protein
MTLAAGDYQPQATIEAGRNSGSAAVTKGVLMKQDPSGDGWLITAAAADQQGPFAVAVKAAAAGDVIVTVCTAGKVTGTADGVLEPNDKLQAATGTAGQVIVFTASTIDAAATDDIKAARDDDKRFVGRYLGLENLTDGSTAITGTSGDAADGDVVWISLQGGLN